jgi:COMPASS component SWD2
MDDDSKPAFIPEETIKSFRVAKVFRDNTDSINGMDFSPHGDVFVTSSVDESLTVYDVDKPG